MTSSKYKCSLCRDSKKVVLPFFGGDESSKTYKCPECVPSLTEENVHILTIQKAFPQEQWQAGANNYHKAELAEALTAALNAHIVWSWADDYEHDLRIVRAQLSVCSTKVTTSISDRVEKRVKEITEHFHVKVKNTVAQISYYAETIATTKLSTIFEDALKHIQDPRYYEPLGDE